MIFQSIGDIPTDTYDILYADPPWDYKGQKQHSKVSDTGGAISHYPTLTTYEMKGWDITAKVKKNGLLFLWATSPHLDQAIELGKAWGFSWATIGFVWDKEKLNPGFYTMSQVELCLVFKKGKIPNPRGDRNVRQLVREQRKEHSKKPDEVRYRINQMFPTQRKLELFARHSIADPLWDVFGNQIGGGENQYESEHRAIYSSSLLEASFGVVSER